MKLLFNYKFTLIVLLLVLYGLFMPGDDVPSINIQGIDKIVHFSMFFTLIATYYFEYIILHNYFPRWMTVCIVGMCFALFTELAQGFLTSSRACDFNDLFADTLGIFSSSLLMYFLYTRSKSFLNLFYRCLYKKEIT